MVKLCEIDEDESVGIGLAGSEVRARCVVAVEPSPRTALPFMPDFYMYIEAP